MSEFQRVGLLGRREHPGVTHVVSELLDLLDGRGIDVVLEDRLATLAHFETRAMQPRDAIGANVDLAVGIGGDQIVELLIYYLYTLLHLLEYLHLRIYQLNQETQDLIR